MSDVRERHTMCACGREACICLECSQEWPCDAIREADRADALLARAQELSATLDECGAYRVEAEDDAERLAAALDRILNEYVKPGYEVGIGATGQGYRALAAHDARVKP